ncbi:MAG: glycosyltransferase family 2 protein [Spirochaetia bacterium]|nr:glycosyltransferase family 2 protein [Spirochaetia bacterium]
MKRYKQGNFNLVYFMKEKPTVSVIIPTYNEKENIPILIKKLETVLSKYTYEILIVDDNSPDLTWETAEKLAEKNPRIRVMRRISERGLSSAVVSGMSAASGDYFAVMDADLQHDEAILPSMIEEMRKGGCDICVGSRTVSGGGYGEWSKIRLFMSKAATLLTRIMLPVPVNDPMSGYFIITRKLFHQSAEKINPRGFKILMEFIGRNPGIKVKETGFTFRTRQYGETKLSGSVIRNFLISLYDIRFGKFISYQFLLYALVGSTGVFVNLGGFFLGEMMGLPVIHTGMLGNLDPLYFSVLFGIEISILSNYILNNFITFYEYRHKGKSMISGFFFFQLISIVGLLVQTGVFLLFQNNGFFTDLIADEALRKIFNNLLGIIAATATNYFLNVNITWKQR